MTNHLDPFLSSYKYPFFSDIDKISKTSMSISDDHMLALVTTGSFVDRFGDETKFLWKNQRKIADDRVEDIINYIDDKDDTLKVVNQFVLFATVNGNDPRVIDGQHRLRAVLSMDSDTEFIIQCTNYTSDENRFMEFVKVNSNTPLPDYFKDITDHGTYCKALSDKLSEAMLDYHPFIMDDTVIDKVYLIKNEEILKTMIFKSLIDRSIPMSSDIEDNIIPSFIEIIGDISIFPKRVDIYGIPSSDPHRCQANKSVKERGVQCPFSKKHGEFCKKHVGNGERSRFNPRNIRNSTFERLKHIDSGFFILNPKWLDIVLDKIYPLVGI